MEIKLKYRDIIAKRNLKIDCPFAVFPPPTMEAFRFVYDPVTHEFNFLPNILFDEKKGIPFDYNGKPDEVICTRCGISLYDTASNAKKAYSALNKRIRENLGYTHLAKGTIAIGDGLMKKVDERGHFGFYEAEKADFQSTFNIIERL